MRVVVLVPMRPDGGHRDRLWAHCRPLWVQRHGWDIFEGLHLDGPFNRSAAINAAAAQAGEWDAAVIIDSDVICDPVAVQSAVDVAVATDRMVVAHDERIMLNRTGTDKVLGGYTGSWRTGQMVERVWNDSVSCCVVVSRKLWDLAGPFDERFVGWGREDTAFRISCEVETGPILKVCGETFHLWHPPAPEVKQNHPLRRANEKRHQDYLAARGDRSAVRALRSHVELVETPIPRILHRTVPKDTTDQVEQWWQGFERLHPGWDLRTYREPIDPADWPLTGDLFDRCQNGAQKAGLIRLEALVSHGGVYVDSDCEPFSSLESFLRCEAFAGWEDAKVVPDAVLGARKGHPASTEMLAKARASVEAGEDAWKSGPGVTTSTLPGRADVILFPPGAFYPMHYLDRDTRELVQQERPPWSPLMHHYHHSWGTDAQKRAISKRQRR